MNSPERPNRPALAAGAVSMLAGAGLLFSHFNDAASVIGVIVMIVAALCIVKSSDWMFTNGQTHCCTLQQAAFFADLSYRITTAAKAEIREVLEKRFGYSFATIYPDVPGLARFVSNMPLREQD